MYNTVVCSGTVIYRIVYIYSVVYLCTACTVQCKSMNSVQVFKHTCGRIFMQVNVLVEVWSCDPLHAMMKLEIHSMIHSYTLY